MSTFHLIAQRPSKIIGAHPSSPTKGVVLSCFVMTFLANLFTQHEHILLPRRVRRRRDTQEGEDLKLIDNHRVTEPIGPSTGSGGSYPSSSLARAKLC